MEYKIFRNKDTFCLMLIRLGENGRGCTSQIQIYSHFVICMADDSLYICAIHVFSRIQILNDYSEYGIEMSI